ncbi:MAG: hypothetical protein ACRD2N_00020 [Vicinamibacterales bacterium]
MLLMLCLCSVRCGGSNAAPARAPNPIEPIRYATFETTETAEALATITVRCDLCSWERAGSEAVVLAITLDDRPAQHLPIVRTGRADYRVLLGAVASGRHTVAVVEEPSLTATSLQGKGAAPVEGVVVDQILASASNYQAISRAPFVYARPDTVGRFTDVPVLMWYEVEPSARGTRYRYTVVFTNEDGGTPADRLMATWGRTTDIEYLYSVELDVNGVVVSEDMQGPKHEVLPFNGNREGQHPLLWVSTENNMVLDQGTTSVRYAPAPIPAELSQVSRETVMDAHWWTYDVMAKELMREGKIVPDAPPGQGAIPDPRRYVYLEGCGEAGNNALAASVNVNGAWIPSDRGVTEYRITRNGCFRAAIPLPGDSTARDVKGVRLHAFARKDKLANTPSRFSRLNTLFSLDEHFAPGPSIVRWEGAATLTPGGRPFEIPVR